MTSACGNSSSHTSVVTYYLKSAIIKLAVGLAYTAWGSMTESHIKAEKLRQGKVN